jgi:hypothetical protein
MNSLESLYCGSSTQVEDVLADSDVACTSALACCDVSEAVFDSSTLSQLVAANWSSLKHPEFLLQALVIRNADRASFAVCRVRALRAKRARAADFWVKLKCVTIGDRAFGYGRSDSW